VPRRARPWRLATAASAAFVIVALAAGLADARPTASAGDPIDRTLLYSCGSTPFPLSAFLGPANDLKAHKPWAKGLRELIASRSFVVPQRRRWRLLVKTKHTVQYGSGKPASGIAWVQLARHKSGWKFDQSAFDCSPMAYSPDAGPATWSIDPTSNPAGSSTSFIAEVLEQSCASGQSPAGRILEPRIAYGASQVVVTLFVSAAPGDSQTCEGNPTAPYEVHLAQPLGGRVLMDGGVFPFRQRFPPINSRR
jgi:hypothetical protein